MTQSINVNIADYDGYYTTPNPDAAYREYVITHLTELYPNADIDVGTGGHHTTAHIDGEPDHDLQVLVSTTLWDDFCAANWPGVPEL